MAVSTTIEGIERYPIVIRYPRELRDTLQKIRNLWISIPDEKQKKYIPLSQVANVYIQEGAMEIRSENARKAIYIYIDLKQGYDIQNYVIKAKNLIQKSIKEDEMVIP